ncbi:metal-sensing transcriptional repressor [Paenibacillus albiflavus]|uniref:Metal-sensing transcriptional repressor n=1 Tax=Paenibacillus albiflavus TaxID=2545760 RepID=A0A4R4E971_9BACL|nr:metal-sensing transcriptional repressor [Paenibacillus albiflavus]TCZ75430.1 metal-sensing transcriptional repressor [Paenibacillus albiflavus]
MKQYEYDVNIRKRLRRVEGQVRGVLQMMDDGKGCKDVVSQLTAVRNAVDKAIAHIVANNLSDCIKEEQRSGSDENINTLIEQAVELMIKSR